MVTCRDSSLHGGVFSGQAEGIPAYRMNDVIAFHPMITCNAIANRIYPDVAHVQLPCEGQDGELRMRKHSQRSKRTDLKGTETLVEHNTSSVVWVAWEYC